MDTVSVESKSTFVNIVDTEGDIEISTEGARECWELWEALRAEGFDGYVIGIPNWVAEDKFDRRRPLVFGHEEYDEKTKGAILFRDLQTPDKSALEAQMYSQQLASSGEILEEVDQTDSEYIDEKGLAWIPRDYCTVFEHTGAPDR